MNSEKIEKPVAGRLLDKLIAEKVLGLEVIETRWGKQKQYGHYSLGPPDYYDDAGEMILHNPLPNYSEDIKEAWEVLTKNHEYLDVRFAIVAIVGREWSCYMKTPKPGVDATGAEEHGASSPEAICRCALKCVGMYWEE